MTIEERVTRLERRIDQLDRIENAVIGLRSDFNGFRAEFATSQAEHGKILGQILATLQELQQRPVIFRWPWQRA
jgi:hypothetical protein